MSEVRDVSAGDRARMENPKDKGTLEKVLLVNSPWGKRMREAGGASGEWSELSSEIQVTAGKNVGLLPNHLCY